VDGGVGMGVGVVVGVGVGVGVGAAVAVVVAVAMGVGGPIGAVDDWPAMSLWRDLTYLKGDICREKERLKATERD